MHDLVFYDGNCGLCHRGVRWLVARDRAGTRFRYAPLGGRRFAELGAPGPGEPGTVAWPDSLLVHTADGRTLARSQAVAHLLVRLGRGWAWLGHGLSWLPSRLADAAYDLVARVRSRLFARPAGTCPIADAALQARFDD